MRTVTFFAGVIALACSFGFAASACQRGPSPDAKLVEVRARMHTVAGTLAAFDPCNSSVEFRTPKGDSRVPLVIIAHGGSGLGEAERNVAWEFRRLGYATLLFDAYKMNGFGQEWKFWAEQVTNDARQRMNYKVTLGAYKWSLDSDKVDNRRIYFHGLSNGANVVVNMAGAVDPAHVRGVFAEGTMMSGIGVPDRLNVPVRLAFGRLDNYGGRREDEWRWLLREPCAVNGPAQSFIQPPGSSRRCSVEINPSGVTDSPVEWFEAQKAAGADIDIWWYEGAAHGMFQGLLTKQTRTWGATDKRYAWTGASSEARAKFLEDFRNFVRTR